MGTSYLVKIKQCKYCYTVGQIFHSHLANFKKNTAEAIAETPFILNNPIMLDVFFFSESTELALICFLVCSVSEGTMNTTKSDTTEQITNIGVILCRHPSLSDT